MPRPHPCLHTLVYPEDRLQRALRGVVLLSDQRHRHILVWQSVRNSAETTPWQDNEKRQQAGVPRAVRATLQAHAVLLAHPSQEGRLQGRSRDSLKAGAHHVPDAQEREGVLSMGTFSFFIPVRSSSNVFYMRAQVPRVAKC